MEGPISKSAMERFPSAVKKLNKTCQRTYIHLRLRKSEYEIANQLGITLDEAREKIDVVRNTLSRAGQIDLIEDPQFVPMLSDDHDMQDLSIASKEIEIDKRLIIKEFFSSLKKTVHELPEHQSTILKLRYKHQMTARDILGFAHKTGTNLFPDKPISDVKEQDIFYALNNSLKTILTKLKAQYNEKDSIGLDNLKYLFEEIGMSF